MKIVPFAPPHLRAVAPQCAQSGTASYADAFDVGAIDRPGLAFTSLQDGVVLGCAGVMPLWPGVGQGWAVFSEALLAQPIGLTRATQRALARISDELRLRRVQATVLDGHDAGARWLAFLGFELEGLLVNYGPGGEGDYWMYGKTI